MMCLGDIKRVLVTRLRFLGDVVMSTPVLETLRRALPDASIEYLTYEAFAPALERNPNVDRVITMQPKAGVKETLRVMRELRNPRIDWAFDALSNPRSAILLALAAPRHSVGLKRGVRSWLFEHRRPRPHQPSAVLHHLDTLAPLLGTVEERHTALYVGDEERMDLARKLDLESDRKLLLIHPGATHRERAWAHENWPRLIERLKELMGDARIGIITQPGSETAGEKIVEVSAVGVERLPVMDLRSVFALLTFASLYVGNDGGILHSAVALKVPTVGVLGGPTEVDYFPYEHWGPYRCVGSCSEHWSNGAVRSSGLPRDLSIDAVFRAAEDVLRESAGPARQEEQNLRGLDSGR